MTAESAVNLMFNPSDDLFELVFVMSVGCYGEGSAPNRYAELLDLVGRVDGGAHLNEPREAERHHRAEFDAGRRAEELAKPEPKDKTSDE